VIIMADSKPEVPVVEVVRQRADIRRFYPADLSAHGPWILKRLMQMFPEADEHWLAGWLRGTIFDNAHLFLYQEDAVCLAQVITLPSIKPVKAVQERFVWVKDKSNEDQLEAAADFYEDMALWARGLRIERLFVCENTDVPKEEITKRIGRIFDTKVCHVRL
jgi:hypothetical protein